MFSVARQSMGGIEPFPIQIWDAGSWDPGVGDLAQRA